MTLIKTSFFSLIATAINMLSGLIINKAIAVFVGPTGLATIGQLQSFIQMTMTVAQGGINTGVTKYTSEYRQANESLQPLISTAFRISLSCSLVVGFFMIAFSDFMANKLLGGLKHSHVFLVFGITIVLFVLNQLLLSIINGFKEVSIFIKVNITQSVFGLFYTTSAVIAFGLDGALIALVTNQSIILLVVLFYLRHHAEIRIKLFKSGFDFVKGKKLFSYSIMALTSAATVPVSHLVIRNYLGETLSWEQAGYWQAVWQISTMYLVAITTALGIYYLPRLSELTDKSQIREELFKGYKVIMPIVALMAFSIYMLRDLIILLLFTPDFMPMSELFAWQLAGDVVKIASWLLAYVMLAKAMTKAFIATEILSSVMFVILAVMFVDNFGLVGVTYAFFLNYTIYFAAMLFIMRSRFLISF